MALSVRPFLVAVTCLDRPPREQLVEVLELRIEQTRHAVAGIDRTLSAEPHPPGATAVLTTAGKSTSGRTPQPTKRRSRLLSGEWYAGNFLPHIRALASLKQDKRTFFDRDVDRGERIQFPGCCNSLCCGNAGSIAVGYCHVWIEFRIFDGRIRMDRKSCFAKDIAKISDRATK
jgi:hypothetical protein